jgi:hypothetical protein
MKRIKTKKKSHYRKGSNFYPIAPPKDYPWVILNSVSRALTDYLDDDLSTRLFSCIRRRDYSEYTALAGECGLQSISRTGLISKDAVRARLMVVSLVKKYQFPNDSVKLRDNAIRKFLEAESHCSRINQELKACPFDKPDPVIQELRALMYEILGELPDDITSDRGCRHGPGSTTSNTSTETSSYFKYGDLPYRVTSRAVVHARNLISSDPRWLGAVEDKYRRVNGIPPWRILDQDVFWDCILQTHDENKITTVPKDGQTDRPIAIENNLNVMLQLGVDRVIRSRLRRFGIDLNTQEKNILLSRLGSMGSFPYTTIDLASASDTVSLRAAKLLLPDEWYTYLCDLRSPKGRLPDGKSIRYSKLSSMGNATTFAVESLIFACITIWCVRRVLGRRYDYRKHIAIHGDDIICPTDCYPVVVRTLSHMGFIVNSEKSFRYGPVKESCGSDWFHGNMVRAVFVKKFPTSVVDLYSDRNRLFRWFCLYFPEIDFSGIDDLYLRWLGRNPLFVGPCSDQEFSSYWHSPDPISRRVNSSFHTLSVVNKSVEVRGCNDFLVRKIMHPLTDFPLLTRKPDEVRAGGSRFDVVKRQTKLAVVRRSFPDWEGCYRFHCLSAEDNP